MRDGCPNHNNQSGSGLKMKCWFPSGSQSLIKELCLIWAEAGLPGEIRYKALKEALSHCGAEATQDFILNEKTFGIKDQLVCSTGKCSYLLHFIFFSLSG